MKFRAIVSTTLIISVTLSSNAQTFEWAMQFGWAFGGVYSTSITNDDSGNVYTTGYFGGTVNFSTGPSNCFLSAAGASADIFVQKFDSSRNFKWAIHMGGTGSDIGKSISVDPNGNVYITGNFKGTADFHPSPLDTFNLTSVGTYDIFVQKIDASGNFVWAKQMGGTSYWENSKSITTDNSGNVYTTGYFTGTVDFDPGPGIYNLSGGGDFIQKLDASGNFVWAKGMQSGISSITVDDSANVLITGGFSNTVDFDPGAGSFNLTASGVTDIFIQKLDSSGNFIWAKQMEGTDYGSGTSIVIDDMGNVLSTGIFNDTVDFDPGQGIFNLNSVGNNNYFVQKLDASGNFLWVKQIGGAATYNNSTYIDIDDLGSLYTMGIFTGTVDFDPSITETCNLTSAGGRDIFIQKMDTSGNFLWVKQIGGSADEAVTSITVDALGNIYTTGSFQDTVDFDPSTSKTFNLTSINGNIFIQRLSLCKETSKTITKKACEEYTSPSGKYIWKRSGIYKDTIPNTGDCDSIITINLTISKTPVADFSINDSSQCLSSNMFTFLDKSTISNDSNLNDTISEYTWIFGDSSFSSIKNPTHHFSNPDTFNVQLNVISNYNCKDSFSKTIFVNPSPSATFIVNDSGQCLEGNKFFFKNTTTISSGNLKYTWDFGDGSSSVIPDPTCSYNMDSAYTVKLLALSDIGCRDSVFKKLTVYPMPSASFGINDSVQCLTNNSCIFNNLSSIDSGNISYSWNFGDTTSSADTSPVHQYSASDTFYVRLVVSSNETCRDTIIKAMIVHPTPKSGFIFQDSFQCFENNDFTFVNTSTISSGKLTYLWNFGDSDTSTFENPNHSYAYVDTFIVKLIATSDIGCKDSISSNNIYIHSKPYADFSVNDSIQCMEGNIFSFTNLSIINSGSFASYWDFDDSNSTGSQNPSHSYVVADSYLVTLIASASDECKDTASQYVYVNENPIADFQVFSPCEGDSTSFTCKSNSGNQNDKIANYSWKYGDGSESISLDCPKHMYNDTGIYSVTLIVFTNKGCIDTIIKPVQIHSRPSIILTGDTIIISRQSGNLFVVGSFNSILWSTGDVTTTIIVTDSGFYTVRVVDNNGCSFVDSIEVKIISNNISFFNTITPNYDGINDKWKILNTRGHSPISINIFNKLGDKVYSCINYANDWEGTWNGKKLSEGTYYYVLKTKDGNIYKGNINILR